MLRVYTGIDPGIVDTGVVRLQFETDLRWFRVDTLVADGIKPAAYDQVQEFVQAAPSGPVYIEDYRVRQRYSNDTDMLLAVDRFRITVPHAVLVNNTGSKQVIRPKLLDLLTIRRFGIKTHHRDLEAAARIMIYGMLKDPDENELLSQFVDDHLSQDQSRKWVRFASAEI